MFITLKSILRTLVLPPAGLLLLAWAWAWLAARSGGTALRRAGWVRFLPQYGYGAVGGWVAVLVYIIVLGSTLLLRWRSRAWQRIRL